jgi:hypothetical protein
MADNITPIRRPRRRAVGHTCLCGATWSPGFSSDPAWLATAAPELNFVGLTHCRCCGRRKLDVIQEQAEMRRAAQAPAIVVQREDRAPATVTQLHPRT